MTALPAASAGANFCTSLAIGEFHGVIAATTPTGSCTLMVIKSAARCVVSSSFKVSHAAAVKRAVAAALNTNARVSDKGLPLSRVCN